jgi:hypothetical protein
MLKAISTRLSHGKSSVLRKEQSRFVGDSQRALSQGNYRPALSQTKAGDERGGYVLIAALNRAISAASKSKVSEWVESTALHLYPTLSGLRRMKVDIFDMLVG